MNLAGAITDIADRRHVLLQCDIHQPGAGFTLEAIPTNATEHIDTHLQVAHHWQQLGLVATVAVIGPVQRWALEPLEQANAIGKIPF